MDADMQLRLRRRETIGFPDGSPPYRTTGGRAGPLAYALVCAILLADALRVLAGVGASTADPPAPLRADAVLVVLAAIALATLGAVAFRRGRTGDGLAFAIGLACGAMFFARTLGSALAEPTSIGWLLHEDWAQHYSGWAMFRHAPWHWPPGLMPEIWYPIGTSIVYTDSLPLLALALKPFSAWLPEPFQYIGFWLATSCALQGGFAALLVARFRREPAIALIASALFVFAPVLISRIGHDTLTAHWLVLAAFWLYFREQRAPSLVAHASPWWLLAAVAALVHPYLAAMTLAIQAAFWWKSARIDRDASSRSALAAFAGSIAISFLAWWASGSMIIPARDAAGGVAYGKYSTNLASLVDPMHFSRWLPDIGVLPGQYEGFAYLGVGMIVLGLVVLLDLARNRFRDGIDRASLPLAVVAAALFLFAAGGVVAIGPQVLLDAPIRGPVLGLFRSSGRFVWVPYYALMLWIVVRATYRLGASVAAAVLAVVLIVQIADFSDAHARTARLRLSANDAPAGTLLDDPRWRDLAAGRKHLTLLPPSACGSAAGPYLPFVLLAAEQRLTVNAGYLARWDMRATGRYCESLGKELRAGEWSADDLYVVGAAWKAAFLRGAPEARCERLNDYDACVIGPAITP
jgi:hypothetical protein